MQKAKHKMSIIQSLEKRRTIYALNNQLPVSEDQVMDTIRMVVELVPDAFNAKTQRVIVAMGEKQNELWDAIYDAFGGKVAREKIDSFKAGAGTVLYFTDKSVTEGLQAQFPLYAANFPIWAQQSNGMLQLSIWSALRELGIGASLQHYNPVIDEAVRKLFQVPESYVLLAEMPFGGIAAEPEAKAKEDINTRVTFVK